MRTSKENLFIHADPAKCMACHSCELACAAAHSGTTLIDAVELGIKCEARNEIVEVADVVMPMQCRHCEDAPCAVACPTGAIYHHDSGFVRIVEENCIACKVCNMVCPFGAITMTQADEANSRTKKSVANKCDLCFDQMSSEGEFNCACVEACPTDAISLVDYETYRKALVLKRTEELAKAQSSVVM